MNIEMRRQVSANRPRYGPARDYESCGFVTAKSVTRCTGLRQAGFSLLESTVAVAILALALPALFGVVRSAVTQLTSIERQDAGWRMADDLMTEAVATLNGEVGIREGRQGTYAWRVETNVADKEAPNDAGRPLFHVKVTVRSTKAFDGEQPLTLDTVAMVAARP